MEDNVTREELYSAIDRQSTHLEKLLDAGFGGITSRLDIANGRTSKLEDRVHTVEQIAAILKDRANVAEVRANTAETTAINAETKVGNAKWWASGCAGLVFVVVEVLKQMLGS